MLLFYIVCVLLIVVLILAFYMVKVKFCYRRIDWTKFSKNEVDSSILRESPGEHWYGDKNQNSSRSTGNITEEGGKEEKLMVIVNENPKVATLEGFLTKEECQHLIEIAEGRYNRSPVQGEDGGNSISTSRTSSTVNLSKGEDDIIKHIEARAAYLVGAKIENLEPMQIVRYTLGQYFKPHYDYFPASQKGSETALARGGQRTFTIFVYLNTPADPHNCVTRFPLLNLNVEPLEGAAVIWNNLTEDGKENPLLLHGGEPPQTGVKYGLNIWFREREFS